MSKKFRTPEAFQLALNDVVYSSRAISSIQHLKGRTAEVSDMSKALLTPGRQPFIFGLRGAGKTSLALSVCRQYSQTSDVLISCAPHMAFGEIIQNLIAAALDQDPFETERTIESQRDGGLNVGVFKASGAAIETKSYRGVPSPRNANEALSMLNKITGRKKKRFCFIIDEFDQLADEQTHLHLGLLAKIIADSGSNVKLVFCGVADNIQQIFKAHPSTLRLFEPIEVNRLGLQACFDIIDDVENRLGISIERETKFRIAQISDGFPYFVHLIIEKTLWQWFSDASDETDRTAPHHYEQGLMDASKSAAVELREPYEEAANRYALDGELLIWSLATGNLLEKQIKVIARDFAEIFDKYPSNSKPDYCLNQNQISARLTHFMTERYGKMVTRTRRSYYTFTEKRMRGYARLRAELQGFSLRPDHPLIPKYTHQF